MLDRARLWLRSIVLRRRLEREMHEEMTAHLARATERLMARGLAPDEARHEARREFGNVPWLQEQARDARGARWVEALAADVRFALRHFGRTPGTTLVMFVVLAVGISISTLLFSLVHSFAVQPTPGLVREDDLVRIRGSRTTGVDGRGIRAFAEDEFREYRELTDQFRAVAGWTRADLPLVLPGDAERRSLYGSVTFVTENFFSVIGLRPALGPGLPAAGDASAAAPTVAVISHATWEHVFNRDPGVIGATVILAGAPVTIAGVTPERFHGISTGYSQVQLWLPMSAQRTMLPGEAPAYRAVARLQPGATAQSASAWVRLVADRVAATHDTLQALEPSTDVVPLLASNGDPMYDRDVRLMSGLVGLLALLVLLVTCTTVSALLTGLAMARRQEIAVRLSLGAARSRLVQQLLTESVLLATVAGATALGLASLAVRVVMRLIPGLPFEMRITWPAATFTVVVALAAGVLFGLSPALHGTRMTLAGALRDSVSSLAGRRNRLQRSLVVAQITFTQPLIAVMATVLVIVLGVFHPRRPTEFADRLIDVRIRPTVSATAVTPADSAARSELRATMQRLAERLRTTPGIEAAVPDWGIESQLGVYAPDPGDGGGGSGAQQVVRLSGAQAAPGYLAAFGTPVVHGREFTPTEVASAEPDAAHVPAIIGLDLAQRLFGGTDPIGRRLQATSDTSPGAHTLTVVGVFDDPLAGQRKASESIRIYLPPDSARVPPTLIVRTVGDAAPLLPAVRAVVQQEAPAMIAITRTLAEIEAEIHRDRRLAATGLSVAGTMALLVSAIGLYAVVAFSVGQRTREIAVRLAVGAPRSRIMRRFVADGVRLGILGLVLGLPISLVGLRILLAADRDFPALPVGPVTAIAACGVLATAVLAAWLPARRASRVDPAVALRAE